MYVGYLIEKVNFQFIFGVYLEEFEKSVPSGIKKYYNPVL